MRGNSAEGVTLRKATAMNYGLEAPTRLTRYRDATGDDDDDDGGFGYACSNGSPFKKRRERGPKGTGRKLNFPLPLKQMRPAQDERWSSPHGKHGECLSPLRSFLFLDRWFWSLSSSSPFCSVGNRSKITKDVKWKSSSRMEGGRAGGDQRAAVHPSLYSISQVMGAYKSIPKGFLSFFPSLSFFPRRKGGKEDTAA